MRLTALCLATLSCVSAASQATPSEVLARYSVRVDPGEQARAFCPVSTSFEAKGLPTSVVGRLSMGGGGAEIPVQLERRGDRCHAYFELRDLAAGKPVQLELHVRRRPEGALAQAGFRYQKSAGKRDLYFGDRVVLRHVNAWDPERFDATYKHFHHVFGMHGEGPLTKGPGGRFTHHRGLFCGFKVRRGDDVWDFWHCRKGVTIRHREYVGDRECVGPVLARSVVRADWCKADGKPVISEERVFEIWRPRDGRQVIDVTIQLESLAGEMVLGGDPHHAGFQFRAANEIHKNRKKTRYVFPEGAEHKGNDVSRGCDWVACVFGRKGRTYSVAHFDHRSNPRPILYSTRDYGRFGSFGKTKLAPKKPLVLRFRLLVHDSEKDLAYFAAQYAGYESLPRVLVQPVKRQ